MTPFHNKGLSAPPQITSIKYTLFPTTCLVGFVTTEEKKEKTASCSTALIKPEASASAVGSLTRTNRCVFTLARSSDAL